MAGFFIDKANPVCKSFAHDPFFRGICAMSVFEIAKGRYRVQVRRKGFPSFDQVFSTREQAEAAQARVLGEQTVVLKPGDITLNEAWDRYRDSVDFSTKSESADSILKCNA